MIDSTDGFGLQSQQHAQPDVLLKGVRKYVVAQLEARRGREPVDRGHVLEEVVAGSLHRGGGGANLFGRDGQGQLVAVEFGVGQRRRIPGKNSLERRVLGKPLQHCRLADQCLPVRSSYRSALSWLQFRMPLRTM